MNDIRDIKKLIVKDKVEEALEIFSTLNDSDEILILLSRWQACNKSISQGTIKYEDAQLEINKIRVAILHLLKDFDYSESSQNKVTESLLSNADKYYFNSQFTSAIHEYKKILNLGLETETVWYRMAYCFFEIRAFEEVIRICNNAIVVYKSPHKFINLRGVVYRRFELYNEARESFELALSYDPKNELYFNNIFSLLSFEGKSKDLEILIDKYTQKFPNASFFHFKRAILYSDMNDYNRALSYVNLAINLNSNQSNYYYQRAKIYSSLGKQTEALTDLDIAYNKVPHIDYIIYKGAILHDFQDYKGALSCYSNAINSDPLEYSIRYNRADVYFELGEYNLALEDIRIAIENTINSHELYELESRIKQKLHEG